MSYTFYDATVPLLQASLTALTGILKKIEAHATAQSIPLTDVANWRLAEDMLPLTFQVHIVTDTTMKLVARVQGEEPVQWSKDDLATLEACHARIAEAQKWVDKADKATFEKNPDTEVTMALPQKSVTLPAKGYAEGYSLPNIFFHLNMAYAIGRNKGVQLGKMDYLVPFIGKWVGM